MTQTDFELITAGNSSASVSFPVAYVATPKVWLESCAPPTQPFIMANVESLTKTGFTIQLDAAVPGGSKPYKIFWTAEL